MLFSPGNTIEFISHNKVTIMMNSVEYQWLSKNKIQLGSDENVQLKEENQRLQEENERYKSVVDAREFITVDQKLKG